MMRPPVSALINKSASLGLLRYRHDVASNANLQPEKKLMLAVLEDAFARFEKHLLGHSQSFREEMTWFMNKSVGPLFSFQNICDALRLDANYLRKYLMQRSVLLAGQALSAPEQGVRTKYHPAQECSRRRTPSDRRPERPFRRPGGYNKTEFLFLREERHTRGKL
jgi:hypothetical protein